MEKMALIVVFLAFISPNITPVIAADYTLGIFGNADMDDTINEDDVKYVRGIIDGTNEATDLADANYDGQIDEDDIAQIETIISGDERSLTIETFTIYEGAKVVTVPIPLSKM